MLIKMHFNKLIVNNTYSTFYIIQQINAFPMCIAQEIDTERKVQRQVIYLGSTRNISNEIRKSYKKGRRSIQDLH